MSHTFNYRFIKRNNIISNNSAWRCHKIDDDKEFSIGLCHYLHIAKSSNNIHEEQFLW